MATKPKDINLETIVNPATIIKEMAEVDLLLPRFEYSKTIKVVLAKCSSDTPYYRHLKTIAEEMISMQDRYF